MKSKLLSGALALAWVMLGATAAAARGAAPASPSPAGPTAACGATVFEDHFDKPALGSAWEPQTIAHLAQGELESYAPSALSLSKQGLAITAARSGFAGYTSGRVHSTKAFHYGCFFIEARIPGGDGIWPALWLKSDPKKPTTGELDMMEERGARPGEIQGALHHWQSGVHIDQVCGLVRFASTPPFPSRRPLCDGRMAVIPGSEDFSQRLHTYGLIWTPSQVTWLVDGRPYFSTTDGVPSDPMIVIMNLAVGGLMDVKHPPDASTHFPSVLQIRSVKVTALR